MKKIVLLFIIAAAFAACKKSGTVLPPYYVESSELLGNSRLDTLTDPKSRNFHYQVNSGKNTVFVLHYYKGPAGASAPNAESKLLFQADSGVTDFTYRGAELAAHLTGYEGTDYPHSTLIDSGVITGHLSNRVWNVIINVTLPLQSANPQTIQTQVQFQ